MSTNALQIPENHVALCLLVHASEADEAEAAVRAAGHAVAAVVVHDADVVFWAEEEDLAEGRDYGLPRRGCDDGCAAYAGSHQRGRSNAFCGCPCHAEERAVG